MQFDSSFSSARRARRQSERRARRRPAVAATSLALGVAVAACVTVAAPAAQAGPSGEIPSFALASYSTPIEPATAAVGVDQVSTEALAALVAADTTIAGAGSVTADIAASGLDIGTPDTSIDTAALQAVAAQLSARGTLVAPFVSGLTAEVSTLTSAVDARVAELRGGLEGAQARKAEADAAEAARVAAETEAAEAAAAKAATQAAAAKQAVAAKPAAPAPGVARSAPAPVAAATGGGDNSPAGAQATARSMLGSRGWGDEQFGCLQSLWQKESGWNYQAYNRSSGAAGIPQALPGSKMASAGADWQTNAATQIAWGFGYIAGRYGTPCGAWSHSQSVGWY